MIRALVRKRGYSSTGKGRTHGKPAAIYLNKEWLGRNVMVIPLLDYRQLLIRLHRYQRRSSKAIRILTEIK